jgi:hypothetical protein
MNIRALAVCLLAACGLLACTQAPPEPPAEPAAGLLDEEAVAAPVEAFIEPTPAMLQAALSGDPVAMRDAAASLSTCHAPTTCTGYGSCSGWSAYSFCNATCGPLQCICNPHADPTCDGTFDILRGRNYFESYRVCFNSAGQSCTEWRQSISTYCGC